MDIIVGMGEELRMSTGSCMKAGEGLLEPGWDPAPIVIVALDTGAARGGDSLRFPNLSVVAGGGGVLGRGGVLVLRTGRPTKGMVVDVKENCFGDFSGLLLGLSV
jgi:hypothetical protein